jgi:hypothetical protein
MRTGLTCGVPARRGHAFCYHHDPDHRERKPLRKVAASLPPLDSYGSIRFVLGQTLALLYQAKLDSRRAAQIMRAIERATETYKIRVRELALLQKTATTPRKPA